MYQRNSLPFGLSLGILLPALTFGILYGIFHLLDPEGSMISDGVRPFFRERTLGIVAIGVNAYSINEFMKFRKTDSMRGIVLATLALVGVWAYFFWDIVTNF